MLVRKKYSMKGPRNSSNAKTSALNPLSSQVGKKVRLFPSSAEGKTSFLFLSRMKIPARPYSSESWKEDLQSISLKFASRPYFLIHVYTLHFTITDLVCVIISCSNLLDSGCGEYPAGGERRNRFDQKFSFVCVTLQDFHTVRDFLTYFGSSKWTGYFKI